MEAEPAGGHRGAPLPAAALFALLLLLAAFLVGHTAAVPFFTLDDSDYIGRVERHLAEARAGNWAKLLDTGDPGNRRVYPGMNLYTALRIALLGKSGFLWHLWHFALFAAVGVAAVRFSERAAGSPWPGVAAFALLLGTGTTHYQSNWYNFFSVNTFEPPLLLAWSAAAWAGARALSAERRPGFALWSAACLAAVLWACGIKETSGAVHLMFGAPVLAAALLRPRWFGVARPRRLAALAAAVLALSVAYLAFVFASLPKDAGYGGTGMLVKTPSGWFAALGTYLREWFDASFLLMPLGALCWVARAFGARGEEARRGLWPAALLAWAGASQLSSLLVWPELSMRLSQPAYGAVLLAACCELALAARLAFRQAPSAASRRTGWALAGLAALAILAGRRTLGAEPMLWGGALALAGLAAAMAAGLWQSHRGREGVLVRVLPAVCASNAAAAGCFLAAATVIHASGYPVQFRMLEGLRTRVSIHLAGTAAPRAKVAWMTPPRSEIFAWSAALHAKTILGREDLEEGPFHWIESRGPLVKGDAMVFLGMVGPEEAPVGSGALVAHRIEEVGYAPPFANVREFARWLAGAGTDLRTPRLSSSWAVVHTVDSMLYEVDPAFAARYRP
ncbi:MAG: hypothetical protein SF028_06960 [Candidatus Sumerlaeia bacterium]|nr:hypothetical protein [Candidatus Sumerlaeia bacterium]